MKEWDKLIGPTRETAYRFGVDVGRKDERRRIWGEILRANQGHQVPLSNDDLDYFHLQIFRKERGR